jgi:DNA invertase Pin-like site-specific DNA recombinase
MKYGYARVFPDDQTPALQLAALRKAGCKTTFKDDGLSGATTKRPALLRCLKNSNPATRWLSGNSTGLAAACATSSLCSTTWNSGGWNSGASPKLTPQQIAHAQKLIEGGQRREEVAALFKVNRVTLYRATWGLRLVNPSPDAKRVPWMRMELI